MPLIFRTEVRPYLYLASAGLLFLGAFSLWGPPRARLHRPAHRRDGCVHGLYRLLNFWVTRAGYSHLILQGHRLSVRLSDALRCDLDLSALGDTSIKIITGNKGSQRLYLCFLPAPGAPHTPRRFTTPKLQPYAETILLNGYIGSDLKGAKDIQKVIDARPRDAKAGTRADPAARPRAAPAAAGRNGDSVRGGVGGAGVVAVAALSSH